MKKLIILLVFMLAFASCETDDAARTAVVDCSQTEWRQFHCIMIDENLDTGYTSTFYNGNVWGRFCEGTECEQVEIAATAQIVERCTTYILLDN